MRLLARTSYPFAHVSCPPTSIALLLPPNLPSQSSTNSSSNKSTTLSTNLRPQDLSTSLKKVAFRRNIVCIPIYPYSLISVLFSSLSVHLPSRNFVDNIPSNLSQVFYHFILFPLLLIFSSFCCILTGFDSAYNLHERSLCSDATRRPRGRARTLSLGLTLPLPSLCASNSTDRTLVPLTWSPQTSTCSSTRPWVARGCDYTRGGRHEGKNGWFGGYLEVLRNRGTAEFHTG